jgi:hypothetical protein
MLQNYTDAYLQIVPGRTAHRPQEGAPHKSVKDAFAHAKPPEK